MAIQMTLGTPNFVISHSPPSRVGVKVTVTNGDDAAVVNFGSNNGNPTVEARPGQANRLDRRTPDGLELRTTHGSLDDLRVIGGPEIRGNNIDDLDVYREIGRAHV